MTGNIALDVVIGLIFIYLLYSLLATIIQEFIASCLSLRAKILERAIFRMLEDGDKFNFRIGSFVHLFIRTRNEKGTKNEKEIKTLTDQFFNHPLIKFLAEDKFRPRPSYIKSNTFSKVIIDLLRGDQAKPEDDISKLIKNALEEKKMKWGSGSIPIAEQTLTYLNSIWTDAQGDVDKFRVKLENWFDETMERTSGWYKKYTQIILFFIGLIIAIVFNVDTIQIAKKLDKDPKLREQVVQQADAFVKAHPNLDQELKMEKDENEKIFSLHISKIGTPTDSILIRREKEKNDSTSQANYNEIKQKRELLIKRANSLIEGDIKKVNGMLGLGFDDFKWGKFPSSLLGWVLTALAISLGAPFWFDLLNKMMKLRSSIIPATAAESTQKETSKNETDKAVG